MPGRSSGEPMNSMPAASIEAVNFSRMANLHEGVPSAPSIDLIVRTETLDLLDSSSIDHLRAARAALIC